jgi:hypothetical protein
VILENTLKSISPVRIIRTTTNILININFFIDF